MIKKIDIFGISIIFLVLILILLNSNQIKISNDSINYIQNSLLINSQKYDLNLVIENTTFYPILYPLIISNFFSKQETIEIFNCLNQIQNCSYYLEDLLIFQFFLFFISAILIFLIAEKIFRQRIISYLGTFFFLINSFYISRISFISSEIISIFFLLLSFYFLISYSSEKKFYQLMIFTIFSSILFFSKPIFLVINLLFFIFLFFLKIFSKKEFFVSIILIFIFFFASEKLKKYYYQIDNYDYELTVIEQRTAYGFIKYNELVPLFFSFIPKIGNEIVSTFFKDSSERVIPQFNSRNYFYNNRDNLNKKKENNLTNKEILIKNLKNLDKQVILTPIFLFRGIFMQAGKSDFYDLKKDSLYKNFFIYFNYVFFTFSKIYLLYLSLKAFIKVSKRNNDANTIFLFYIFVVFFTHSILTHNLPRYTSILFGIGAVFLIQKIYKSIKKNLN